MNSEINRKFAEARKMVMMARVQLDHLSDAFSATGNHTLATTLAHMSNNLHRSIELFDSFQSESAALYLEAVNKADATTLAAALSVAGKDFDDDE